MPDAPFTKSWTSIARDYRGLARLRSFASFSAHMVSSVARLRSDQRLTPLRRWLSHFNLILADDRYCVAVHWSDRGGPGWAGKQGFAVYRVNFRTMRTRDRVVVAERSVVKAVLERFAASEHKRRTERSRTERRV